MMQVTAKMVDAAIDSWMYPYRLWRDDQEFAAGLRIEMCDAIDAALDAAPSGYGERG